MDSAQNKQNSQNNQNSQVSTHGQVSQADQVVQNNQTNSTSPDMSASQRLAQAILEPENKQKVGLPQNRAQKPASSQKPNQAQTPSQQSDQAPSQNTAQSGSQKVDPLAKLIGMVKGSDGEADPIKVKKLFVVERAKMKNEALQVIVNTGRQQGLTDTQLLDFLLALDNEIELGNINEEFFNQIIQNG
jgi:hypothetical protein